MADVLDSVIKRLRQINRQAGEDADLILATKTDLITINALSEQLVDQAIELVKVIYEIYRVTEIANRRLVEHDPGYVPDKLADLEMMIRMVRETLGIEYIGIATRLAAANKETILQTIVELNSLDGQEQIKYLKEALT